MSTPARLLSSSPAMCWGVPTPGEANESFPGWAFASANSSATLFAGTSLLTARMLGITRTRAIGASTLEAHPCGGGPDRSPEEEPEQAGRSCDEYSRARILGAQQWMNGCNACGRQIRVDGQCGPQTERCLRAFQSSPFGREQGLEVSAAPDRKTIVALREFCQH